MSSLNGTHIHAISKDGPASLILDACFYLDVEVKCQSKNLTEIFKLRNPKFRPEILVTHAKEIF